MTELNTEREALLPCPFCGAGQTQFQSEDYWTGQRSKTLSVTIRHWCEIKPGELSVVFGIKAKTEEAAIAKWNTRAQASAPAWIAVNSAKDVPVGDWLVYMEEKHLHRHVHSAHVHPNLTVIGSSFAFDCPRVIAYAPIPEFTLLPQTERNNE